MQKKRTEGLCFNCNERFTAGYKCIQPQLLLLNGTSHEQEAPSEEVSETTQGIDITEPQNELVISLHALIIWSSARTMRVTIRIGHHEVLVLIDRRSTHNFFSDNSLLHLSMVLAEPFAVRVVNGN